MLASGSSRSRRLSYTQEEANTLALAVRLTLEDIQRVERMERVKRRAGVLLTDAELALSIAAQETRASMILDEDRALARNLQEQEVMDPWRNAPSIDHRHAPASQSTTNRLPSFFREPQQHGQRPAAQAIRSAATLTIPNQAQQRMAPPPASAPSAHKKSESNTMTWLFDSVMGWMFTALDSDATQKVSESARFTGHTCVICQDPIRGAEVRAPCGDYYDKACVLDLFHAATRDESLYPPRCCRQIIPFSEVRPLMDREASKEFEEKGKEFSTLKRVYCSSPTCSRFLGPQYEGWLFRPSVLTCPDCGTRTCSGCKAKEAPAPGPAHVCKPVDETEREVLALGEQAGWARCPGCSTLIELNVGCYHMTCRCKTQFCYLCKLPWKTCPCVQWDENRLIAAAEMRVDANLGRRRAVPAPAPAPAFRARPAPVQAREAPVIPVRAVRPPAPIQPTPPVRPAPTPAPPIRVPAATTQARVVNIPANTQQPTPTPVTRINTVTPSVVNNNANASRVPPPSRRLTVPATTSERTLSWVAESSNTTRPAQTSTSSTFSSSSSSRRASTAGRASIPSSTVNAPTFPTFHATTSTSPEPWHSPSPVPIDIPRPARKTARDRLVQEAINDLRENHDCQHVSWKFRNGGGKCENCHHELPHYLFRCGKCQLLACNRCRRNRL